MDRDRYDFVTVPPGQFLSEYNVPLGVQKVLALKPTMLVGAGHTNLLWPYSWVGLYLCLCGESLKVAKSRPEPDNDTPCMWEAELMLITRDLFSGAEAFKSAGRSSCVK